MTTPRWDEPGVVEVAPDVHRIPLPLPGDALRAVNVYAIQTDDGMMLIDAGWDMPSSREALVRGLAVLGAELGDVRSILVTHVHRDHYTLAVSLRRELGTHVALGAGERPSLTFLRGGDQHPLGPQLERLRLLDHGLADEVAGLTSGDLVDPAQWAPPDTWLTPGSIALPGARRVEVIETPGHTAGHVVFHDTADGLLFAGDHVLPTITPSIGFESALTPDPLGAFLRSLAVVRARPDAVLLPAHGPVAPSVHARIDELVEHHGQRLHQAQDLAQGRGVTARDVAGQLRWTRREHRLDDLDPFNAMLAVFETAAHLDLLVVQGRLAREPGAPDRFR